MAVMAQALHVACIVLSAIDQRDDVVKLCRLCDSAHALALYAQRMRSEPLGSDVHPLAAACALLGFRVAGYRGGCQSLRG